MTSCSNSTDALMPLTTTAMPNTNAFIRLTETLASQVSLMTAAAVVLSESQSRVTVFKDLLTAEDKACLSAGQLESCEALTSRFARLNDFLVQQVFRTIDRLELIDDTSIIDRLERAEARGLIDSAEHWRQLHLLRNEIAHDYLIEAADRVLHEALESATELLQTAGRVQGYARKKGYCKRWPRWVGGTDDHQHLKLLRSWA